MSCLTLDTGALIALERHNTRVRALLDRATARGDHIAIPAGVLAQAWRAHPRQHPLHVVLSNNHTEVVPLDLHTALACGAVCASASTHDVVDASVVVCARERDGAIVTSDPDDITALDPGAVIIRV